MSLRPFAFLAPFAVHVFFSSSKGGHAAKRAKNAKGRKENLYLPSMKSIYAVAMALALLAGCRKDDEENPALYAGKFTGDIDVQVNGSHDHTIFAHTLTIHPATVGDFSISDNVVMLSSADIKHNLLTLPRTRVGTGPTVNVYNYGTGIFSGDTLTIEFHMDREDPASNQVLYSEVYEGKLLRRR